MSTIVTNAASSEVGPPYAGETGDVRHLKTMAVVLASWELLHLTDVLQPATGWA